LLDGSQIQAELVRARLKSAAAMHNFQSFARINETGRAANFRTKTKWSDFRETAIET
jgi:hypothetical protein